MKVCVPVTHDQGLQSPVSGHFGSAPLFVLVDTGNLETNFFLAENEVPIGVFAGAMSVLRAWDRATALDQITRQDEVPKAWFEEGPRADGPGFGARAWHRP